VSLPQAQPVLASPCASALSADRFISDAGLADALLLRIDHNSSRAAVTGVTSPLRVAIVLARLGGGERTLSAGARA
jgi:hypothetical protein